MKRCLVFDCAQRGMQYTNMTRETVIQELNDVNLGHD